MKSINQIVIVDENIYGNLKKCNICNINFSAMQPCIMCAMRMEKEKELGRRLTQKEWDILFEWLR